MRDRFVGPHPGAGFRVEEQPSADLHSRGLPVDLAEQQLRAGGSYRPVLVAPPPEDIVRQERPAQLVLAVGAEQLQSLGH
jgi:hypothetical protein